MEKQEKARNHYEVVKKHVTSEDDMRISKFPPEFDAKWRYMWPIGERAEDDPALNIKVIPEGFKDWTEKMDKWGNMMVNGCKTASQMAAVGLGLPEDFLLSKLKYGNHLLAPTGSDLNKYGPGTAFAGFHYDISFLTIHGRSRFPGLYIWLRNWKKVLVKIPPGCLLLQAGISFENITGGYILAGYHEVVHTQPTQEAVQKVKEQIAQGVPRSLWRVSSTLFSHFSPQEQIGPLQEISHLWGEKQYPALTAHEMLMRELSATNMVSQ